MRVGLITTLNTNIGDDFIREGILSVLKRLLPDEELDLVAINKHDPVSLYPKNHPLRLMRSWVRGGWRRQELTRKASRVFSLLGGTQFDDCDAIIQCGAPVYWKGCGHETTWREDLWQDVVARLHRKIPVLNLAAGACYAYRNRPERFTDEDAEYARWLHGLCRATTVRDPLAAKLLQEAGCAAELIACSAFLFTSPEQAAPSDDGPILINYMRGGGHYDWAKDVDAAGWEATVRTVIARLRPRHRVVMLCHNEPELALAREIAPDIEHVLPRTYHDFPALVRTAKAALCNRLHASVALAGMGIPAVSVGTDTRLLMVEQLGLPCHFVADTNADLLLAQLDQLMAQRSEIAARLLALQQETRRAYERVLQTHLALPTQKTGRATAVAA